MVAAATAEFVFVAAEGGGGVANALDSVVIV